MSEWQPGTSTASASLSEEPRLVVDSVGHTYTGADGEEVKALDDSSFTVARGAFASLIGPSGCGKSTLLCIVGGLLRATSGESRISGEPVTSPSQDTGYMFQSATLLDWRTVLENIVLPIEVRHGRKRAQAASVRARELLNSTGLNEFEDSYPRELSGGMAQRVAICRMLVTDPDLLLLDEPFGALDEITRETMNEELQRVCLASGATSLMVTHSIPEAVFLSDAVFVMSSRPGHITTAIEIDLPRPRTFERTPADPRYSELVNSVRAALRPQSASDSSADQMRVSGEKV